MEAKSDGVAYAPTTMRQFFTPILFLIYFHNCVFYILPIEIAFLYGPIFNNNI